MKTLIHFYRCLSLGREQLILSLALCLTATSVHAQSGQGFGFASPNSVGMSAALLDNATVRLQRHVDEGDIAGVVAAVARDGKIVYFEALGQMDIEQAKPMRENALFRTYSMTRQVTSTAVLIAAEQGLLDVNDPVANYLPNFADQRVLSDPESTDISQNRERVGEMTIAHLLTHTSGLGSRSSAIYRENNVRDRAISLDQMTDNAARVPLFNDPGVEFRYGISATILGKVIEVASGQKFENFLRDNLLIPLGMDSTVFWADENNVDRLATVYRPVDGVLRPHQIETVPFTENPELREGGVGLLSTVMDFMRFSQMILNGGEFGGNRFLGQTTTEQIFNNHIPDSVLPLATRGYFAGSGWSLGGFNVVLDNSHYSFPVSEGTIWWDGSAGTRYFIDPNEDMVIVIMAQVSPSRGNGFRENFKSLVNAAITERREAQ